MLEPGIERDDQTMKFCCHFNKGGGRCYPHHARRDSCSLDEVLFRRNSSAVSQALIRPFPLLLAFLKLSPCLRQLITIQSEGELIDLSERVDDDGLWLTVE